MKRRAVVSSASLESDTVISLLVGVLATVLLLILNATGAAAQSMTASNNAASVSVASTARLVGTADAAPVAHGKLRVTWPKATRAMQRGETLRAEDFVLVDTVIVWTWKELPSDTMTAVTGWTTRRPIAMGDFMHGPSIAPGNVITLGQMVKVLWQDGNVRLTLTGTATNNAAMGAPVGVRIDKNRRLDGIAVAPNTVRLR